MFISKFINLPKSCLSIYIYLEHIFVVGRFAKEQQFSSRGKRSASHFDNMKIYHWSKLYYTILDLPAGDRSKAATIAAALADWSAKAPVCFQERVSSSEPTNFFIRFTSGIFYVFLDC